MPTTALTLTRNYTRISRLKSCFVATNELDVLMNGLDRYTTQPSGISFPNPLAEALDDTGKKGLQITGSHCFHHANRTGHRATDGQSYAAKMELHSQHEIIEKHRLHWVVNGVRQPRLLTSNIGQGVRCVFSDAK